MSLSKMLEELPRSQARFCPQLVDAMRDNTPLSVPALLSFLALISFMAAPAYAGFNTAPTYPAGTYPSAIVVADFNGDGIPDLAVANEEDGNYPHSGVTILLGQGDGAFQLVHSYSLNSVGTGLAVGDFNNDGYLDLAVANNRSGKVSILLGNGDGSFKAAQDYAAGPNPISVAVGDFNGDGIPDLAVVNFYDAPAISILLGNGDGTFRAPTRRPTGPAPVSVVVGDFNGDGVPDLAVVHAILNGGSVSVSLGNGDGTFRAAGSHRVGDMPSFAAVGDFNGDGILDLAAVNEESSTVSILLGNGDGTFQKAVDYTAGPFCFSVAVGDFNEDGHLDLAVACLGTVSILLGNGDGTFQAGRGYAGAGRGAPGGVAVADFNRDGHLDIASADSSDSRPDSPNGSVSILLGRGDATFPQAARSYFSYDFAQSVAVGDFNGDGIPDLVTANYSGTVSVFLGNSDGTFQDPLFIPAGLGSRFVAVGDFNGDGKLDFVTANFSAFFDGKRGILTIRESDVRVFLGNGDGTFQPAGVYSAGPGPTAVAVGDFNGDGIPDLAVADGGDGDYAPGNKLSVLLGNGDGTFQPAVIYSVDYSPRSVTVGDFNGDGIPDLALAGSDANRHAKVSVRLGKGDGTFQAAQEYAVGSSAYSLATGDFDGDGIPDLVVAGYADPTSDVGTVSVLRGNGDGSFQAPLSYAACRFPFSVAVADFNRDGIPDFAVASAGASTVSVLLGNGDGTFQAAQSFPVGCLATSVAAADFNGDGFPDLALTGGGSVTVLINDTHWRR